MSGAVTIWKDTLGPDHPNAGSGFANLATLYHRRNRKEDAEQYYRLTLPILAQSYSKAHPELVRTWQDYVTLSRNMGRESEAAALESEPSKASLGRQTLDA